MAITVCQTEYGPVEGLARSDADVTEFRGIPYARPPVGKLRFAPPERPEPWVGVHRCDTWPDAAVQNFFDPVTELYPLGQPRISEDCLYLNVWTPAKTAGEKLPVFLWYHDGGLTNGWAYDPRNDPLSLVEQGIVVVAPGHRLGELGYMALPQLSKEQGTSGAYGVMDDLLALQWVHDNIAAFGGDPENVTLGGESGGTFKCAALVALPEAKGLFRRVISQSGLAWLYPILPLAEAEAFGQNYLHKAGLDPDMGAEALRALPLGKFHIPMHPYEQPGKLVADGRLLRESFREDFLRGAENLDFLNCVCSGDALVPADPKLLNENGRFSSRESFFAYFRGFLGELYGQYDFENLLDVRDDNAWELAVQLASLGLAPSHRSNFCRSIMANRLFAAELTKRSPNSRVYNLRFSQIQPPRTDRPSLPDVAAPHGSDLWYSNNSLRLGIPPSRPWREKDRRVAQGFNSYLGNFIKTGNPNGGGLPDWPRSGENLAWFDLCDHPSAHIGLEGRLDALIREHTIRCYQI